MPTTDTPVDTRADSRADTRADTPANVSRTAATGARPSTGPRLRTFHTPVRGHAFAAPPPGAHPPAPGTPARLWREPTNPADELAVAVWVQADDGTVWRLGYLDRGVAARIAPRLDAGIPIDARVEGWSAEPEGRWQRPLVALIPPQGSGAGDDVERRLPGVRRRRIVR